MDGVDEYRNQILIGDVREQLRKLPDGCVQCCVTSPPYWGLRQYLFDGAVMIRSDLTDEEREFVLGEMIKRGIKPRI